MYFFIFSPTFFSPSLHLFPFLSHSLSLYLFATATVIVVFASRIQHSVRSSRTCFMLFRLSLFFFSFIFYFLHFTTIYFFAPVIRNTRATLKGLAGTNEICCQQPFCTRSHFSVRTQLITYTAGSQQDIIHVGFVDFYRSNSFTNLINYSFHPIPRIQLITTAGHP